MAKIVTENVGNFAQHYPKLAVIVTASSRGRDNAISPEDFMITK